MPELPEVETTRRGVAPHVERHKVTAVRLYDRRLRWPVPSDLPCRVVGVGNIYANEALFRAGIRPTRAANRISRLRLTRLVDAVRHTLTDAIAQGGSTLRDYVDSQGRPGYFQQAYFVYGRGGEPCRICGSRIRTLRLGGRATCFCPRCQR